MTPTQVGPEFQDKLNEEFGWIKFIEDMEALCAQMERETPAEKMHEVTLVMKYPDFKLFLRSARHAINKLYGVGGGQVQ